jgi:putrescine aminotransferase
MNERSLFLRYLAQTSSTPLALEIVQANGSWLTDRDGKTYLDLISGISVSSLGHGQPRIVEAIKTQADHYLHLMVYGELIQSPQVKLAVKLLSTLPPALDNVFFLNSGSEAIEGAMKLAKRYTGRPHLISCHKAYHGSSHGALSLGGTEAQKQAFRPLLPGIRQIHYGSFSDLSQINEKVAAVFIETIQGEAGVVAACPTYFKALRTACDQAGALLVLDEIQCGMGRTGSFWAFEAMGILPDVLVTAKALGAGLPLGAFIAPKAIMQCLSHDPVLGHISTFGGHPLSCAAALAGLELMLEEQLVEQVAMKAEKFRKGLEGVRESHLRQQGLLMALELGSFERVQQVIQKLLVQGVFTDWFLNCDTALRLAPALTIKDEDIDWACEQIREAAGCG